jgi:flagellar basal-body rod modification protein FlgD
MKQSTGLNKDDFLKLFIEQLKNQDPLNPQDSSQFIGQMAQLTQVEQAYNTNTNLASLISAVNSTSAMNSTSYIGKTIMANGNNLYSTGTGAPVAYNLPVATTATSVTISDASGKAVRTISMGAGSTGDNFAKWDGTGDNGATLPAGVYTFSVTGKGSDGSTINGATYTTGTVDSISLKGGSPVLQIGPLQIPIASVTMIG